MKYFSFSDASDKHRLLSLKKDGGISISLGLPALNEEATIGKVIECAESCQPLVDEIIVFDSGSTDNTLGVCSSYGVRVVADEFAAQELSVPLSKGKGWNLWSSVHFLSGDVVAWIDTDIENIHPRFVMGIIAPFLLDPEVKFTKGYYKRPKGDARVTELLARPFLNMLFPETAEFIQPLAGEYAGTRDFLEKAVFYSGYSVEVALILQAILEIGPERVAQVFLDERIHPLQDVPSLGKMAGNILYTLLHLAEKYQRLTLHVDVAQQVKVFSAIAGSNQKITSKMLFVADSPLPRMVDLKPYQARQLR